ncbi:hypothetical protein M422DRAFT_29907 [Sphaerobolus stellatus SS14]|uniref:DNA repair protein RAD5 n=1 Tax=Sphaerobolus stellatus (strain SS14) TaxID=990650 RepID=A0A0C9W252_SPHS4|nr:hypothetical protein M422DRAFT_29907 [Sphaerobolus stellatus SS14]
MVTTSTTFSAIPNNGHSLPMASTPSFSNTTIDLTGDDDDDDDEDMDEVDTSAVDARNAKRPRIESSNYGFSPPVFPPPPQPAYSQAQTPRDRFRAQFASNSNTFFPNRAATPAVPGPPAIPHSISVPNLHHPKPQPAQPKAKSRRGHVRQVIELTSSPSPPPPPGPGQPPHPHLMAHPGQYVHPGHHLHQSSALQDVPARTPVCIGQLTVTALILYPTHYVNMRSPGQPLDPTLPPDEQQGEFASVRLRYDQLAKERNPLAEETIHILTPQWKVGEGDNEKVCGGDNFGVVEQRVATVLGPMLGKGLIRVDAKIRRGAPNLPILSLHLLLFTPKGNIPIVSSYLHNSALFLDHPIVPFDLAAARLKGVLYSNPHNPPPGGFARAQQARGGYGNLVAGGHNGFGANRWSGTAPNGKSVEIQRNQVDQVFHSLKSGDELEETYAPYDINSTLYPHQMKALTFLLEREGEISGPQRDPTAKEPQPLSERWSGTSSSSALWQIRRDEQGNILSWTHAVTNKEVTDEPRECKAALLADDMGLGKTITCVSLIAATLPAARLFGNSALDRLPNPFPSRTVSEDSAWGMSSTPGMVLPSKIKQPGKMEEKRIAEDYNRACRLKVKSRGTLIVCPLSTVVNWEDQFKEHWGGEVSVVGGASSGGASYVVPEKKAGASPIRVYVYHGNSRNSDPRFLADFDAVITTFATLASEFSKQMKSGGIGDEDDDSDDMEEVGIVGGMVGMGGMVKKKSRGLKRKKGGGPEQSSPLQMVHWFRVVLDEAHCIKETSTVASRASCDLIADRRLCLTGTPVQNKLDDVYALIKFLRLEPFDDKSVWTEYVGGPVKFGQSLGVARLGTIMKCITLRRTKESTTPDGTKILHLPPRRDELRLLKFDEKERKIYDSYFDESKAEFNQMSENNEVMKNYVGILQKILRLRQICDHYELVKGKGVLSEENENETVNYEELVAEITREGINQQRGMAIFTLLRESGTAQCVECGIDLAPPVGDDVKEEGIDDEMGSAAAKRRKGKSAVGASRGPTRQSSPSSPRAVLTRCQHLFCIECFCHTVCPGWPNVPGDLRRACSTCQAGLTPYDAVEVVTDAPSGNNEVAKKKNGREKREKKGRNALMVQNLYFSTKIKALMADLVESSRQNPNSRNYDPDAVEVQMVDSDGNTDTGDGIVKTVVFSQWTSMLDKIEDALELADIQYDRLDGTMKRDERTRAMDALKHNPSCEVLLVSLKAGGVGLNLTAASRVYLVDPYWNPAVENQAVDRIHRLGQTKPVTTVKLIIEKSIEERLLKVQQRKTELANMTLSQNLTKAELHQRRLEELSTLFGD